MVPTAQSPQDGPHSAVPTRYSPQDGPHKMVATSWSPQEGPHKKVPTAQSPQDGLHTTQDGPHNTVTTTQSPQHGPHSADPIHTLRTLNVVPLCQRVYIEIIQYVYACKLKLVVYTVLFSPPNLNSKHLFLSESVSFFPLHELTGLFICLFMSVCPHLCVLVHYCVCVCVCDSFGYIMRVHVIYSI